VINDAIPSSDHIARYCPSRTAPDGAIQATAFMLRSNEPELSVNWLEFLKLLDRPSQIGELRQIFNKKMKVGANAKFAVLNVGQVVETVRQESEDSRDLTVLHKPAPDDESHAEILGLRQDDELIAEIVVQLIQESFQARP
jgi:hypothetical protein